MGGFKFLPPTLSDGSQKGLGLRRRDFRLKPRGSEQKALCPISPFGLAERKGRPEFALREGVSTTGGHHADYFVTVAVYPNLLADDTGIAGETPLPELVAKQGHKLA